MNRRCWIRSNADVTIREPCSPPPEKLVIHPTIQHREVRAMPWVSKHPRFWLFGLLAGGIALGFTATARAQAQAKTKTESPPESTTEPRPRDGGWKQLHESFLARAKAKEGVGLLFLGD